MGLVAVVMSSTSWKPMSGVKAKYKIQETVTTYKFKKAHIQSRKKVILQEQIICHNATNPYGKQQSRKKKKKKLHKRPKKDNLKDNLWMNKSKYPVSFWKQTISLVQSFTQHSANYTLIRWVKLKENCWWEGTSKDPSHLRLGYRMAH